MKEEKKLKDSLKIEASAVLDSLDFEIMIIDADYRIIFANQALLEELGVTIEELMGRHCYAATHHLSSPCKPPSDPCPIQRVIETKKTAVEMHTHYKKDGSEFLVNVIAAPMGELAPDIFLHIDMPVDEKVKKEEAMNYMLKKTQKILDVINMYQKRMEELMSRTKEIEKFNSMAVDREIKMIELKKRIKWLEDKIAGK